MTFYSIIFGVLFLESANKAWHAILGQSHTGLLQSITLMLLIASDVIYTSHVIEEKDRGYSFNMKLFDLLNFFLLGLALIALDPMGDMDFYDRHGNEGPPQHVGTQMNEPLFWGLVCIYWIVLILWNINGRLYKGIAEWWAPWVQPMGLLGFIPMFFCSLVWPDMIFTTILRVLIAIACLMYLITYKRVLADKILQVQNVNPERPVDHKS